ncbi:MAG: hypothetical protein RL459_1137, partial [Pseudomonadota bacterium]
LLSLCQTSGSGQYNGRHGLYQLTTVFHDVSAQK